MPRIRTKEWDIRWSRRYKWRSRKASDYEWEHSKTANIIKKLTDRGYIQQAMHIAQSLPSEWQRNKALILIKKRVGEKVISQQKLSGEGILLPESLLLLEEFENNLTSYEKSLPLLQKLMINNVVGTISILELTLIWIVFPKPDREEV